MTPEEFAQRMRVIVDCKEYNIRKFPIITMDELVHVEVNALIIKVLKSLGYEEGAKIFEEMGKWYA